MEVRKSQSFTLSEVTIALEILKFSLRINDLKVLVQRPDFITLYRKFSKMREKMLESPEIEDEGEETQE